jgi:hypothetical protein
LALRSCESANGSGPHVHHLTVHGSPAPPAPTMDHDHHNHHNPGLLNGTYYGCTI